MCLSGDCSDERRFNMLFRCFLNEYTSITVSNCFAPSNTLFSYFLDSRLKLYPCFRRISEKEYPVSVVWRSCRMYVCSMLERSTPSTTSFPK